MEMNDKSAEYQGDMASEGRERLLPLMFEMGRLLKSEITRDGLAAVPSFLHLETLRFIQDREKAGKAPTMSDISDYLKITPPSATALVNSFVKEGVIERVSDPEDRRRVRLALSIQGHQLLEEAMQKRAQAFARVFASLSSEDCIELSRILTIITQSNSKNL
jgi:DNA-binding MarR family transcriptional regulator